MVGTKQTEEGVSVGRGGLVVLKTEVWEPKHKGMSPHQGNGDVVAAAQLGMSESKLGEERGEFIKGQDSGGTDDTKN